jgi:hypothetical protein
MSEAKRRSIRGNLRRFVHREVAGSSRLSRVDGREERIVYEAPVNAMVNANDAGKFILDFSKLDGADVLG